MPQNIKQKVSFKNPPVIEVSATVQFADLPQDWALTNLEKVRAAVGVNDYPKIEFKPPLGKLVPLQIPNELSFKLSSDQEFEFPRIWLMSEDETHLIQIQNDRLSFNWRKLPESSNADYSKFDLVWKKFKDGCVGLDNLIKQEVGQHLQVQAIELAYLNSIPFKAFGGVEKIDTCMKHFISHSDAELIGVPTQINFLWEFNLQGTILKAQGLTIKDPNTGDQVLRFDLVTRKFSPSPIKVDSSEFEDWFDIAHDRIIDSFVSLTADTMHEKWGKYS